MSSSFQGSDGDRFACSEMGNAISRYLDSEILRPFGFDIDRNKPQGSEVVIGRMSLDGTCVCMWVGP